MQLCESIPHVASGCADVFLNQAIILQSLVFFVFSGPLNLSVLHIGDLVITK